VKAGRLTEIDFDEAFQSAAGIRDGGLQQANASVIRTHFLTFCGKPVHGPDASHALTIRRNIDSAQRLEMTALYAKPANSRATSLHGIQAEAVIADNA
jgi:hypothetical protein